ncbi:GntR family transcriptional regulator [Pseudomonas capsici]|uniref:GntR family transcriptional regulator n=1 Tax=Pseudomonas capsici TaxID=2810614 RepID=A0ABT3C4H3_9PSED|nr:GntR family transcriptional regulator [Pseudomonas capsici]MBN6717331.1 GntR family transcriptional regulator [Pseudomonas capsici]MBN6722325.1 GntR family transcriptional regulator [Pseudomonas capsici]MBN6727319.1 GntR family transcriptional regulator [Pseudomonas capsici]MCV4270986.1 GntR family transcriptional regulator [Pseudomonas capsici]MCV4281118.1 GntR family transcriptional regulator [Pseudomonas capsici]
MQISNSKKSKERPENMAERIYLQLKEDIFEFRLLPGDRFSESEIAERVQASRTPVRQALYQLEREGYVEVYFRSGWQVKPFDFNYFEELYDVRIILETAAVARLSSVDIESNPVLDELKKIWLVEEQHRLQDTQAVSVLDERFHCNLVEATGNAEMARMHFEITEKIRIIRRLDFTQGPRVTATYEEHGKILNAILQRRTEQAQQLLKAHIEVSKKEVRKITLHMLHVARQRAQMKAVTQ